MPPSPYNTCKNKRVTHNFLFTILPVGIGEVKGLVLQVVVDHSGEALIRRVDWRCRGNEQKGLEGLYTVQGGAWLK